MATTTQIAAEHDALIVGAGVIGLACAWRAAQRGLDVLVLERERPGAGASNVAAGMLAPVGEASWGEDRLLELALASHRLWPEFAAELASGQRRSTPASSNSARCTWPSTATRPPSCAGASS